MTLSNIVKQVEKIVKDQAPTILTAVSVTGLITTAVLTGRASIKAKAILDDVAEKEYVAHGTCEPRSFIETVKLVWTVYIPPVGVGAGTIICMVAANRIGTRRAAALAAAYSLSEKAFVEYKDKVVEKLGQNKEQKVRDEIAQDQVNANPVSSREVIMTGLGMVLFYDSITGRYFESNVEYLRKAQNDINAQILNDMYASLSDFYNLIGLPETPYSSEVGWNAENLLTLNFSAVLADDGRPCISVNYDVSPIRDYYRLQ
jgi:Family of unknown function (DUF6353)